MYLSFFIRPENKILTEIKEMLEEVNFTDIQESGQAEPHRIAFFNGRTQNNFCYTAHKLFRNAPEEVVRSPFLVQVGANWTRQGLVDILTNYSNFRLLHFGRSCFPAEKDFHHKAREDRGLCEKLFRMEETVKNCDCTTEEEIGKVQRIREEIGEKSAGEVKREIFYFYIDAGRITLPWGNPPSGKEQKDILIEWLKRASVAFPRGISTDDQRKKDLYITRRLEETQISGPA